MSIIGLISMQWKNIFKKTYTILFYVVAILSFDNKKNVDTIARQASYFKFPPFFPSIVHKYNLTKEADKDNMHIIVKILL